MKMELAASGMSEEEILHKAQLLMKAFGKEEVGSTAEYKLLSKQKNKALIKAEIPPKDFSAVSDLEFFLLNFFSFDYYLKFCKVRPGRVADTDRCRDNN